MASLYETARELGRTEQALVHLLEGVLLPMNAKRLKLFDGTVRAEHLQERIAAASKRVPRHYLGHSPDVLATLDDVLAEVGKREVARG